MNKLGFFWKDDDTVQGTFVVIRKSDMTAILTLEEREMILAAASKIAQWRLEQSANGIQGYGHVVVIEDSWPEYKGVVRKLMDRFNSDGVVKHSHYHKDVSHLNRIDVYRVLQLFNVTNQAVGHAIKKLLVAGGRGAGKDYERDLREAADSINRALQMIAEDDV